MKDETQSVYNYPPQVSGTTLSAIQVQFLNPTEPPDSDLVAASVVFQKDGVITISPEVVITDSTNWVITIGSVSAELMAIDEGFHQFDIKTTDATGQVRKYVRGEIQILPTQQ